ncbi:MAG TPA: lysophospholipid acyltransferase family protein [Phycisphaerae bacterium]|nr:lysophospholipid acyltransferase family protein [Phycisphaerae bacterium]
MHERAADSGVRARWGRVWFGYRANAMMLWVGRRALWLGYFFVWWGAVWFFVCVPGARRASGAYLDRVRGKRGCLRRGWDSYRHMVTYGYLLLDRAVMLSGPGHGFEVVREGMEQLHAAAEAAGEEGMVVLTAHFGNAEAAMPLLAGKMGTVLRERKIHVVMWQDMGDATERFHARTRRMMKGMEVISTTDALRAGVKIIAALRAGGVVGMRADRRLEGKTVGVALLGGKVELPAGPFVAAALTGAPVVSVYTCRLGYRKYGCLIGVGGGWRRYGEGSGGSREERVERAARDYAAGLEEMIRKYPLQWGNFYDLWAG